MNQKVKYIEEYPEKIEKTFENNQEYWEFWNKRYFEIDKMLDFYKKGSYAQWIWKKYTLNKNGKPRKPYNPTRLQSKESREKQREKFAIYCEKRKKETKERDFRRKKAEIEFKIDYWKKQLKELECLNIQK